MGMIRIEIVGSFSRGGTANFPAQHHGHADAVARAIAYLSGTVLPLAIKQDHELHDEDARPDFGFGRDSHKKEIKDLSGAILSTSTPMSVQGFSEREFYATCLSCCFSNASSTRRENLLERLASFAIRFKVFLNSFWFSMRFCCSLSSTALHLKQNL